MTTESIIILAVIWYITTGRCFLCVIAAGHVPKLGKVQAFIIWVLWPLSILAHGAIESIENEIRGRN